jgi:hypothetical protein
MKVDQFKTFLSQNSFIICEEEESIGSLWKKIEENKNVEVIIKMDETFRIFNNTSKFQNLCKNALPQMQIRKFILKNNQYLKDQIEIEVQSALHSILTDKLGLTDSPTSYIRTIGKANKFESTLTHLSYSKNPMIEREAPPPEHTFRAASEDGSNNEAVSKPYYIVSEFADQVQSGKDFTVNVFLSREKVLQSSPQLDLQEGWQIDILLTVRSGLDLTGEYQQSIIVNDENIGKKLPFTLKAGKTGNAAFLVMALHKGVLLFSQEYTLNITEDAAIEPTPVSDKKQLEGKPQSLLPDLTLLIHQGYDDRSKVLLNYTLYSPDQSFNLNYKSFKSPVFQKEVSDYFLEFFNDIDSLQQSTKKDRVNAVEIMKSRCATLYRDLFPEDLRKILWSIHDKIKSIIINSEEPWIPWEICFVYSEDEGIDRGFFLCEKYEVSRWIPGSNSPVNEISFSNAAFVIPEDSQLQFPPEEKKKIEEIIDSVHGKSKDFEPTYLEVKKGLASGDFNVWHFSGHGTDSNGTNINKYKIILDDGDALTPEDITGMKSMGKGKPLVFFNACQASRPGMGLTGLSGWPKQLIDNNISAFIGAYWSVKDSTAYQLSTKFYEVLAAGEPIAAALKTARLYARDNSNVGDPTWLAYTLYANPFAKVALN